MKESAGRCRKIKVRQLSYDGQAKENTRRDRKMQVKQL